MNCILIGSNSRGEEIKLNRECRQFDEINDDLILGELYLDTIDDFEVLPSNKPEPIQEETDLEKERRLEYLVYIKEKHQFQKEEMEYKRKDEERILKEEEELLRKNVNKLKLARKQRKLKKKEVIRVIQEKRRIINYVYKLKKDAMLAEMENEKIIGLTTASYNLPAVIKKEPPPPHVHSDACMKVNPWVRQASDQGGYYYWNIENFDATSIGEDRPETQPYSTRYDCPGPPPLSAYAHLEPPVPLPFLEDSVDTINERHFPYFNEPKVSSNLFRSGNRSTICNKYRDKVDIHHLLNCFDNKYIDDTMPNAIYTKSDSFESEGEEGANIISSIDHFIEPQGDIFLSERIASCVEEESERRLSTRIEEKMENLWEEEEEVKTKLSRIEEKCDKGWEEECEKRLPNLVKEEKADEEWERERLEREENSGKSNFNMDMSSKIFSTTKASIQRTRSVFSIPTTKILHSSHPANRFSYKLLDAVTYYIEMFGVDSFTHKEIFNVFDSFSDEFFKVTNKVVSQAILSYIKEHGLDGFEEEDAAKLKQGFNVKDYNSSVRQVAGSLYRSYKNNNVNYGNSNNDNDSDDISNDYYVNDNMEVASARYFCAKNNNNNNNNNNNIFYDSTNSFALSKELSLALCTATSDVHFFHGSTTKEESFVMTKKESTVEERSTLEEEKVSISDNCCVSVPHKDCYSKVDCVSKFGVCESDEEENEENDIVLPKFIAKEEGLTRTRELKWEKYKPAFKEKEIDCDECEAIVKQIYYLTKSPRKIEESFLKGEDEYEYDITHKTSLSRHTSYSNLTSYSKVLKQKKNPTTRGLFYHTINAERGLHNNRNLTSGVNNGVRVGVGLMSRVDFVSPTENANKVEQNLESHLHYNDDLPPPRPHALNNDAYDAVNRGDLSLLKTYVECGVDVNWPKYVNDIPSSSPLIIASSHGNFAIVKFLLQSGAHINWRTRVGYTPLIVACLKKHKAIVSLLISYGADFTFVDFMNCNAKSYAQKNGWDWDELLAVSLSRNPKWLDFVLLVGVKQPTESDIQGIKDKIALQDKRDLEARAEEERILKEEDDQYKAEEEKFIKHMNKQIRLAATNFKDKREEMNLKKEYHNEVEEAIIKLKAELLASSASNSKEEEGDSVNKIDDKSLGYNFGNVEYCQSSTVKKVLEEKCAETAKGMENSNACPRLELKEEDVEDVNMFVTDTMYSMQSHCQMGVKEIEGESMVQSPFQEIEQEIDSEKMYEYGNLSYHNSEERKSGCVMRYPTILGYSTMLDGELIKFSEKDFVLVEPTFMMDSHTYERSAIAFDALLESNNLQINYVKEKEDLGPTEIDDTSLTVGEKLSKKSMMDALEEGEKEEEEEEDEVIDDFSKYRSQQDYESLVAEHEYKKRIREELLEKGRASKRKAKSEELFMLDFMRDVENPDFVFTQSVLIFLFTDPNEK